MRLRIGTAAAVVAAVFASSMAVVPAIAAQQTCYWDPGAGRLRCDNLAPGGPPAPDGGGGSNIPEGRPLGRWLVWMNDLVPDPTRSCAADPVTRDVPQRRYLQFLPSGDPDRARTVNSWCPPADPPVPPPPPTAAELRGLAQAPAPTINVAPNGRGVTGLPVRLWADPPAPVAVGPLVLRGWSVKGRAESTKWEWSMGDMAGTRNPDPNLSSTRAGSAADPAATYTYETKGGYTITMTVTYNGGFTVTGPFGVTVNADIGAVSVSASRAYDVIEVRSARD